MTTELQAPIEFTKLTAAGNDFVCLDNTRGKFDALLDDPELSARFARNLCARGLGVGCDGVIYACDLGTGDGVDVSARFFEPDGSEVELCGNGAACFCYWVMANGLVTHPEIRILTQAGIAMSRSADFEAGMIEVCVPNPENLSFGQQIEVNGEMFYIDSTTAGVPHAVIMTDDLENLDVRKLGKQIRHHPHFTPRGVNVNFVKILDEGHVAIRTYEFGVEDETLACGTGASAAAILTALRQSWPEAYRTHSKPVSVDVRGGETLQVWFRETPQEQQDGTYLISDVCLQTRVQPVYHGALADSMIERIITADTPFEKISNEVRRTILNSE